MIITRHLTGMLRLAACLAAVALSANGASAQERYIPPGYGPDMNMYWAPSGRIPEVLRPLPPGYQMNSNGDLVFHTPPGFIPVKPPCCGPLTQWLAFRCQEKQSFHMYIRGYGPAIHTRPASVAY